MTDRVSQFFANQMWGSSIFSKETRAQEAEILRNSRAEIAYEAKLLSWEASQIF